MHEVSFFAELLGHLCYHFNLVKPFLPLYGHIILSALFSIYISAHASLSRPSSAARATAWTDDSDVDDDETKESQSRRQRIESLGPTDALIFPLIAGFTLSVLYVLLTWLRDAAVLNKVISFYFSQLSVYFITIFLRDSFRVLRSFIFPRRYQQGNKVWTVNQSERFFKVSETPGPSKASETRRSPLPGIFGGIPLPSSMNSVLWLCRNLAYRRAKLQARIRGIQGAKVLVGLFDIVSVILAVFAAVYFAFVEKPWWLTNFLGFSFSYNTLQLLTPSTFGTGSLLLSSLFFYDIYFVFYTPMMVTVAKKLDAPVKLLFPRPPGPGEVAVPSTVSLAMLGLGDIIIPGMVICLALRFDLFLYYKLKGQQKVQAESSGTEVVKPQYQRATGGWGERFWSRPVPSKGLELEPPYHDACSFPKTYFKASITGYTIGLAASVVAMQYSGRGQPALLYLVPGVLISLWGTAMLRGDIRDMWDFSDVEEDNDGSNDKGEKSKAGGTAPKNTRSLFLRAVSDDITAVHFKGPEGPRREDGLGDSTGRKDSEATTAVTQGNNINKEHRQDKDGDIDIELFSVSISLPKWNRIKKGEESTIEATRPDTREVVSTGATRAREHGDEPPAKRPRTCARDGAIA